MSEEKLFEYSETFIFTWPFFNQLLHDIVHDLHEASHLFFREVFPLSEVAVQVCELLQNANLGTLLKSAVQVFD